MAEGDGTLSKSGCGAHALTILQRLKVPGDQEQVRTGWRLIIGVLDGGLLVPPPPVPLQRQKGQSCLIRIVHRTLPEPSTCTPLTV